MSWTENKWSLMVGARDDHNDSWRIQQSWATSL